MNKKQFKKLQNLLEKCEESGPLPWKPKQRISTDARLGISAINALPELLNEVERLQSENAKLKAKLATISEHPLISQLRMKDRYASNRPVPEAAEAREFLTILDGAN